MALAVPSLLVAQYSTPNPRERAGSEDGARNYLWGDVVFKLLALAITAVTNYARYTILRGRLFFAVKKLQWLKYRLTQALIEETQARHGRRRGVQ